MIDTDRAIASVTHEIDVGPALLGPWVAQERARMGPERASVDVTERAELERLRREVSHLRMDNEFLSKAAQPSSPRNATRGTVRGDRPGEGRPDQQRVCVPHV